MANDNYISRKDAARIARENRKIISKLEKQQERTNVPASEYMTEMKDPKNVLEFDDLHTFFFTDIGTVKAVNGVSFSVPQGSTVGIVGESGCGKSVMSLSLMRLLQRPQGQIVEGSIRLKTDAGVYDIAKVPAAMMQNINLGILHRRMTAFIGIGTKPI